MSNFIRRRRYVVESDLQFWFVIILISTVSVEGIFIGYGVSRLINIASNWQSTHMAKNFFIVLSIMITMLIGVNFLLGIFFSHKLAGPLYKIRKILREIKNGDLSQLVQIRNNDLLQDFVNEFNETMITLNKLVGRNKSLIRKSLDQVDHCQEVLDQKHTHEELKEVKKQFVKLKSYIVTIDSHFKSHSNL